MTRAPYDPSTFWGTIAKRVDRDFTKKFVFAGNCKFTLVNSDTNVRLTFRIRRPKSIKFHPFISQMYRIYDYAKGCYTDEQREKPWCRQCGKRKEHPFHWVEPDCQSKYRVDLKINLDPTDNKGWECIGYLDQQDGQHVFKLWERTKVRHDNPALKTMPWFLERLQADTLPDKLWVYHMGCCARCGKDLIVPTSIEMGIGPDCIEIMNNGGRKV